MRLGLGQLGLGRFDPFLAGTFLQQLQRLLELRDALTLGLRPEHLGPEGPGVWEGFKVELVEPMGADNLAWVGDGKVSLAVRMPGEQTIRPGTPVRLGLDPRNASLFAQDSGERV